MAEANPARYRDSAWPSRLNGFIFHTLLVLLILAPIPLGSNRDWAWSFYSLCMGILSLAWCFNALASRQRVSLAIPIPIIVLFLIPCLWAFLQAAAWMPDALGHPLWSLSAEALQTPPVPTISMNPDATITAVMRLMSYGLVFFLALQFCRNPRRAHTVLTWLAIAGTLYAVYGLLIRWGILSHLYWGDDPTRVSTVTSTFVNRNSYAAYAGLGLICVAALLFSALRHHHPGRHRPATRQELLENAILDHWKPLLALLVITTALVSTHSRGGVISSAIAFAVLLLIYALRAKPDRGTLILGFGSVVVVITLAWLISNETLLQRVDQLALRDSERLTVFGLTLDAIRDNPWLGFGYGSFEEAFKLYRSPEVQYIYGKTHNTWLENTFELGIPAALSLFLALGGLALIVLKGVIRRRRDWIYPAAGLAATVLFGVHSLVDFSIQIPAIAMSYSAILGMAVAQSFSSQSHGHNSHSQPASEPAAAEVDSQA